MFFFWLRQRMFQPERVVIYDVFEISCNAVFEYVPLKMVIPARIFSVLSPGVHMEELKVSAAVVGNYLPFAVGSYDHKFCLSCTHRYAVAKERSVYKYGQSL